MSAIRISPSLMASFARCGMQVYYYKVLGIIDPPGIAALRGRAAHRSIEANLKAMVDGGGCSREEVEQIAADTFAQEWSGSDVRLSEEELAEGRRVVRGRAKDEAIGCASCHHKHVAPKLDLVPTKEGGAYHAVERWMEFELEGIPNPIGGKLDVLEGDAGGTWRRVRDTKTAAKAPAASMVDSIQLDFYSLAVEIIDGVAPESTHIDALVLYKRGAEVRTIDGPGKRASGPFIQRALLASEMLEKGSFYPADPTSWICSAKWCGYFDRCPYGAARRVQA